MKRRFSAEELYEAKAGSETSNSFTASLRKHGWVWIRLPESAAAESAEMRAAAAHFFALPEEEKTTLGPFRRAAEVSEERASVHPP